MSNKTSSGVLVEGGHEFPVRVYYEDTDFTGLVYHARYLHFFERGRTEWLRLLGIHHHELAQGRYGESLAFTIRSIHVEYKHPARIDDSLLILTCLDETRASRIILDQTLFKQDVKIASAKVEIVLINMDGKPRRIPKEISSILQQSMSKLVI